MAIIIKKQSADGTVTTTALQASQPTTPPLPHNLFTQASPEVIANATTIVNEDLTNIAAFKNKPSVVVHNLFEETLSESAEIPAQPVAELPPWEIDPSYSILVALTEFSEKKFPKKTLRIVNRTNPVHSYKVKEFDPDSGRAKLEGGFKGGTLKPVITEREAELYYPVWS